MLDQALRQPLGTSGWTVYEARGALPQLGEISTADEEKYAAEHFLALCTYLDQLHGEEFDRLLSAPERRRIADHVRRIVERRPTGSPIWIDDESDLADDPLGDIDLVIRLDQPVNSVVTLAEGRALGQRLARSEGWQADLGHALTAVYAYLDELHGGPEQFVELLTLAERAEVAAGR